MDTVEVALTAGRFDEGDRALRERSARIRLTQSSIGSAARGRQKRLGTNLNLLNPLQPRDRAHPARGTGGYG